MGNRDSSKTRVTPVMDRLIKFDRTGNKWLKELLLLPGGWMSDGLASDAFTIQSVNFGKREKSLAAPIALLSWLIRNPRAPQYGKLSKDSEVARIRQEWIDGSQSRIREGIEHLHRKRKKNDWHIFEGSTKPDIFIETDSLLVVIEGKRTETGITTGTKWMKCRHQMLRHLDAAWEIRGNRNVVGFFIVEGNGTADVPSHWCNQARQTTSFEVVRDSLPHRSSEEQQAIAGSFAGVTTWQRVCQKLHYTGLNYEDLPNVIK